ncbi:T-complex protein 11-domain-containing protein [Chytridium lagenaria]|nr:T-complex protein 11-domain-containing protein [Chytridium lagenaria]
MDSDAFKRLQLQVPPRRRARPDPQSQLNHLSRGNHKSIVLVPESLRMDAVRLMTYRNDWQDVTIMAALLILFRQAAGAKCTSTHLATMKRNLWVLLNDAETSMQHIVLELGRVAGEIRGKPFSKQESELLSGMVDKTLSPKSKLYSMISGRVGEHLGAWMKTVLAASSGSNVHPTDAGVTSTTSDTSTAETPTQPSIVSAAAASTTSLAAPTLDKSKIARHGLTELEEEIRDLAERIGKLSEFNRATYFEVYAGIYEEVRGEAARASSSGTTNAGGSVACVGEPAGHASSSASTATSAVSTVSTSTKSGDRGGGEAVSVWGL